MTLFSGRRRVVGLDIGSKLIKAVEIEHLKDGYLVTNVAIGLTPEGSVVEGEVIEREGVIDTIRSLLSSSGIKCRNAVSAVAGKDVIIKRITMDKMEPRELREVIGWEAEQHIPFEMEDVVLDFQIIKSLPESSQMDVLLVAAKKDRVNEKVELLYDCDLIPTIVDVDSFALTNAFEYNHSNELSGIKCLMNIGKELTSIIIFQDGVLLLARDVASGTGILTDELQRVLGMEKEEAESSLLGVIPEGKSAEEIQKIIFGVSERLLRNLERANSYIKTTGLGEGIEDVYLCGGGAKVPWLTTFLREKLNRDVTIPDPFRSIVMKEGIVEDRIRKEMAPIIMLSVGLAMRKL
ncbi:MAG: type IV pilus assembly protein PilM [Candidatus Glassbacteria bacterium]